MIEINKKPYDYLNENLLPPPNYTLYRLGVLSTNQRFYYTKIGDEVTVYTSGTTMINDGYVDNSKGLEEWRVSMRVQGRDPDAFARERADYGTIMHILFGAYLKGADIDLDNLSTVIKAEAEDLSEDHVDSMMTKYNEELQRDLLAFATFVRDYNVKPIAIELMLKSDEMLVGTAVDLICSMDIPVKGFHGEVYKIGARKGEPKETTEVINFPFCIVDFKSGKKGFYDKHALQLGINRNIFFENYPEFAEHDVKIFNFSPKDWKTAPSFNLKDQSASAVLEELDDVISVGRKRHLRKSKIVKVYKGVLNINNEFNWRDHFSSDELLDVIKESEEQGDEQEQGSN